MASSIDFVINTIWRSSGVGNIVRDANSLSRSIKDTQRAVNALSSNRRPGLNMMNDINKTTRALQQHSQQIRDTMRVYNNTRSGAQNFTNDLDRMRQSLTSMAKETEKARAQKGVASQWTLATQASSKYTSSINGVIDATAKLDRQNSIFDELVNGTNRLTAANERMARMWGKGIVPGNVQSSMRREYDQILNVARTTRTNLQKEGLLIQAEIAKMVQGQAQIRAQEKLAGGRLSEAQRTQDTPAIDRELAALDLLEAQYRTNETRIEQLARAYDQLNTNLDRATVNETEAATSLANLSGMMQANARMVGIAQTAWTNLMRIMASVRGMVAGLATTIGNILSSALNTAARAVGSLSSVLGRFGSSASAGFARLRSALDGTGRAFMGFGRTVQSSMANSQRSMNEFLSAGWSLLGSGALIRNYGRMGTGMFGEGLDAYMGMERALLRAGVAGDYWYNTPTGQRTGVQDRFGQLIEPGATRELEQLILDIQTGRLAGQEYALPMFSAEELSSQLYTLVSSIGVNLADPRERRGAGAALGPLGSLSYLTQTDPSTVYKSVFGVLQQFGYDPREILRTTAPEDIMDSVIGQTAAQFGILANISSMEIPDITEMFKMTGPMINQLYGGEAGAGLTDTMIASLYAANVGMRGSQVGRGISMLMSSLLDPQKPALDALKGVFGSDATFESVFMTPEGTLENGLQGVFTTLASSGGTPQAVAKLMSELFSQNVTRVSSGIAGGMPDTLEAMTAEWEYFENLLTDDPAQFMAEAIVATQGTVSASFDATKNAWEAVQLSIISGVRGPLIEAFQSLYRMLFDIADALRDNPALAEFIGRLVAFGAVAASITGSVLVFTGAMLLLIRAFSMMGGLASSAIGIFTLLPSLLASAIVPLLLLSTVIGGLFLAWNNNVFGMRTAWEDFRESLSVETVAAGLQSMLTWVMRIGSAFKELIMGIFLGTGPTNNLSSLLGSIFGDRAGGAIFGIMLDFSEALSGVRDDITGFVTDLEGSGATIGTFVDAFRQLTEAIFFGGGAASGEFAGAFQEAMSVFGVDLSYQETYAFFERINQAFQDGVAVVQAFAESMRSAFSSIGDNLRRMTGSFGDFFSLIGSFAVGVFVGFFNSILQFVNIVNRLTGALADGAERFQRFADSTQGAREKLQALAQILGVVVGTWLGARLIAALVPGVTMMASFVLLLGQGATAAVIFAARLGLAVVQMALLAAASAVTAFAGFVAFLVTTPIAFLALAAAVAFAMGAFDDFDLSLDNIISTFQEILAVAIEVGTGFVAAFAAAFDIISAVVDAVSAFLGALDSSGIISFNSSLQTLGFILGGVVIASLLGGVTGFNALGGAILSVATSLPSLLGGLGKLVQLLGMGRPGGTAGILGGLGIAAIFQAGEEDLQGLISQMGVATTTANELANAISNIGTAAALGFVVGGPLGALAGGLGMAAFELYQSDVWKYPEAKGDWNATRENILAGIPVGPRAPAPTVVTQAMVDAERDRLGGTSMALSDEDIRGMIASSTTPQALEGSPYTVQRVIDQIFKDYGAFPSTVGAPSDFRLPQTMNPQWRDEMLGYAADSTELDRRSLEIAYNNALRTATRDQVRVINPYATGPGGQVLSRNGQPVYQVQPGSLQAGDMAVDASQMMPINQVMNQAGQVLAGTMLEQASVQGPNVFEELYNRVQDKFPRDFNDTLTKITDKLGLDIEKGDWTPDPKAIQQLIESDFSDFASALTPEDSRYILEALATNDPEAIAQAIGNVNEAMNDTAEEINQAAIDFNLEALDAFRELDLATAIRGATTPFAEHMGLPQAMAQWGDLFTGIIPEEAGWSNLYEGIADVVGMGQVAEDGSQVGASFGNILGQNMHEALVSSPGFMNWIAEMGVSVEDALVDIPKFMHIEEAMPAAFADLITGLEMMGPDTYQALDHLATDMGRIGVEWQELSQYAIGQAMAGQEWDLADYIAEAWGMEVSEAESLMAAYGIDPGVITSDMFGTTQQWVNSMGGEIALIGDAAYAAVEGAVGNIISLTQSQFDALSVGEKIAITGMGYAFYITPENTTVEDRGGLDAVDPMVRSLVAGMGPVEATIQAAINVVVEGGVDKTPEGGGVSTGNLIPTGFSGLAQSLTVNVPTTIRPVGGDGTGGPTVDTSVFGDGTGGPGGYGIVLPELDLPQPTKVTPVPQVADPDVMNNTINTLIGGNPRPPLDIVQPVNITYTGAGAAGFPMGMDFPDAPEASKTVTTTFLTPGKQNLDAAYNTALAFPDEDTFTLTILTPGHTQLNAANYVAMVFPETDSFIMTIFTPGKSLLDGAYNTALAFPDSDSFTLFIAVNGLGGLQAAVDAINAIPPVKYSTTYIQTVTTPQNTMFFAEGGLVTSKWAVVGENGPELVQLPYGTYVYDAGRTERMTSPIYKGFDRPEYNPRIASGGGDRNVHIGTINIANRSDADYLMDRLDRELGVEIDRRTGASRKSTSRRSY